MVEKSRAFLSGPWFPLIAAYLVTGSSAVVLFAPDEGLHALSYRSFLAFMHVVAVLFLAAGSYGLSAVGRRVRSMRSTYPSLPGLRKEREWTTAARVVQGVVRFTIVLVCGSFAGILLGFKIADPTGFVLAFVGGVLAAVAVTNYALSQFTSVRVVAVEVIAVEDPPC